MKIFLLVFFTISLETFSAHAQDTLTASTERVAAQNKKLRPGDFWIKLALQKPVVVSLDGDCPAKPAVYIVYQKTQQGWKVKEERRGVNRTKQCGLTQVSGLVVFLPFRLNEEGIYKIVLPIGGQNYFTGEIEVVDKK